MRPFLGPAEVVFQKSVKNARSGTRAAYDFRAYEFRNYRACKF